MMKPRKLALRRLLVLPVAALPAAAIAQAPQPEATVIAIPVFATAKIVDTDAGTTTWGLANQIAELITADLQSTNAFLFADAKKVRIPSYPEITAPSYPVWRGLGAKLLLSGFVNARSDGRLTVGCYVYDVQSGREVARQGFAVSPNDWRRAAHRCADAAYMKATGKVPIFDSRIAYVSVSGRDESPVKRLAVMDFDGNNHRYVTDGQEFVQPARAVLVAGRQPGRLRDLQRQPVARARRRRDERSGPAPSPGHRGELRPGLFARRADHRLVGVGRR